jgi:hypothetical protein
VSGWHGVSYREVGAGEFVGSPVRVPPDGELALAEGFCPRCTVILGGQELNWCPRCSTYWNRVPS